jgi:diacylglycerol O-acyltransferase
MKRLGLMDDAFLRLESRRMPLHIGVLILLEPPANAGKNFARNIADRLRQSTRAAPPFNRRLVQRRGINYWEEDDEFDLDQHFAHMALPQPGRVRELLAMVSRVHSAHLDREYPLWRMYLIEGLEDGRIAVYLKMHHSLVDGVSGMKLLLESMGTSAAASRKLPPPWEVETRKSRGQPLPVPTPAADSVPALRKLAREGFKSVAPVLRELRSTYGDARKEKADLAMFGDAPPTLFNQKVSASRRVAAQSYSTPRIRAVADTLDATLNDVVLAMCAGALRRYLVDRGELPKKALTAAVPVSIRRPDSDAGNEVAFTMTTLATNLRDPAKRLHAIKRGMDYNKDRLRKLSPGQVMAYTAAIMIPGQLNSLLGRSKDSELGNVVISHVPGPRKTMYWQGAKLAGLYPISLNIDGGALNITLVSRHDFVDFGLIACRKAVPSVQRLLEYLEEELVALEAATGASGRAVARGKSSRKKTTRGKAAGAGGAGRGKARTAKGSATGRRKATPRRKP